MVGYRLLKKDLPALGFGLIIISGVLLRLSRLTYVTVWIDELYSIKTMRLPWGSLLDGKYPSELNPPFYFLLLKSWDSIWGENEISMRILSILFSIASLILMYLVIRRLGGDERVGFAGAALLAFHPMYLFISTEIRMYSLLVFATLLSLLAYTTYIKNQKSSNWWLLVFILANYISMNTHYFGVLLPFGFAVYSLGTFILKREKRHLIILLILGICALLYIPTIKFILIEQVKRYLATPKTTDPRLIYRVNWSIFPALFSGSGDLTFRISDYVQVVSLLAVFGGITLLVFNNQKTNAISISALLFCVAALTLFISSIGVNIASRYLLHIILFSLILGAFSLSKPTLHNRVPWLFNLLGIFILVVYAYSGIRETISKEYPIPDWRAIANFIDKNSTPEEPTVIMGWDANPLTYYLRDRTILNSYDLEREISQSERRRDYIIVDTEFARELPYLSTSEVLLEIPGMHVEISKYVYSPAKPH